MLAAQAPLHSHALDPPAIAIEPPAAAAATVAGVLGSCSADVDQAARADLADALARWRQVDICGLGCRRGAGCHEGECTLKTNWTVSVTATTNGYDIRSVPAVFYFCFCWWSSVLYLLVVVYRRADISAVALSSYLLYHSLRRTPMLRWKAALCM